jgi:ABC-2 type transport system permease protein
VAALESRPERRSRAGEVRMRNIWTITKREINLYFVSPIAYVVAFAFLLVMGLVFFIIVNFALVGGSTAPTPADMMNNFFAMILLLASCGVLTMRLFAEEQRTGTIELLLTAPVREWELVLGKWLAALGFMVLLVVVTGIYMLILNHYTQPGIDMGALFTSYLGLLLMIAAMLAVGVFASTLFNNQIASFFVTLVLLLAFWLVQYPFQDKTDAVSTFIANLSFYKHYADNFTNGVLALTDITYFVSVVALFLFLATRTIESRRWR